MTGQAYCANCDRLITFALTGYSESCTHCAGKNFEAAPDQACACGEPMRWMHQPPPEPLEFAFTLDVGVKEVV